MSLKQINSWLNEQIEGWAKAIKPHLNVGWLYPAVDGKDESEYFFNIVQESAKKHCIIKGALFQHIIKPNEKLLIDTLVEIGGTSTFDKMSAKLSTTDLLLREAGVAQHKFKLSLERIEPQAIDQRPIIPPLN